jgi:hypothetical protein
MTVEVGQALQHTVVVPVDGVVVVVVTAELILVAVVAARRVVVGA